MSSLPRGSDFTHGLKDPQNILIPHGIHKTVAKRQEQARANADAQAQADAEAQAVEAANVDLANQRRKRRLSSLFAGGRSILGAPAGRGAASGAGTGGGSVFAGFSGGGGGGGYSDGASQASSKSAMFRSYGGPEF